MKIIAPLYITLGRKTYTLTLSQYRNWHYRVSNALKKEFKCIISPQIQGKKIQEPYKMHMILYYKRKVDIDNFDSVISKFTNDALVEMGCVSDDNVEIFVEKSCKVGGKDVNNPRMEIEIG